MVLKETKKGKGKKKSAASQDGADNQTDPQKKSPESKDEQIPSDQEGGKKETNGAQDIETQLAAEKEKLLRVSAEFENFKKRKQRETDEFKKFANETIFKRLLTVVDNLERAISSAEDASDEASLLEGVKLTHKDILNLFEAFNVTLVDAENQPFDPNFHQAVTQEETDEVPDNTVTTVLQKGYLLHDRLIRPAMVVVSKRVEKETEKSEEN